jgi:hypothetical protein
MPTGMTLEEYWRQADANRAALQQQAADANAAAGVDPDGAPPAVIPDERRLQIYRNLKDKGYQDDEIKAAFDRHSWPLPPSGLGGEFVRGLKRGGYGSAGALVEGIGGLVGSEGMIQSGQGISQLAEAPELSPGVGSYTGIESPLEAGIGRSADDIARYVTGGVAGSVPEMGAMLGAGLAAGAAVPAAPVIAGAAGAAMAAFLPNLGRNVEEQLQGGASLTDVAPGTPGYTRAVGAAAGQAALDSVIATRIEGLVARRFLAPEG